MCIYIIRYPSDIIYIIFSCTYCFMAMVAKTYSSHHWQGKITGRYFKTNQIALFFTYL